MNDPKGKSPGPQFDGLDPDAAGSYDVWNRIYLISALMHPAQTDELDTSHLAGFENGLEWSASFPMRMNTHGLSLRDVAFRMLADIEADALVRELGMDPVFEEGLDDTIRSAMDENADSSIEDSLENTDFRDLLPERVEVRAVHSLIRPLQISAEPDMSILGGSLGWVYPHGTIAV